jgi:hypothetical protein
MVPELRAVLIEVPGGVLEMREGSGEAPVHEAEGCHSSGTTAPRSGQISQSDRERLKK